MSAVDSHPAVVAQCAICGGVKGVETELGNQETIDRWFARGYVLSRQTLGWFKDQPMCRGTHPDTGKAA